MDTCITRYNSEGTPLYQNTTSTLGKKETLTYTQFDHHDNWIEAKSDNGNIIKREINYFNEEERNEISILINNALEQKRIEQYCSIESARNQVLHYMSMNYPDWEICTEIRVTKTDNCVFNVQFQVINPHTTMRQYGIVNKEQIIAELSIIENYTMYNFQIKRGHLY